MTGDSQIEVSSASGGPIVTFPVGPDGKARVPADWPGGTILFVSVGRWPTQQFILVEVISTLR
ncbi:MAG: hypothetical protein IPK26_26645 [Planctomycetes bacterium]|nr:hypothetical protein [Planctomycetota bacterium]